MINQSIQSSLHKHYHKKISSTNHTRQSFSHTITKNSISHQNTNSRLTTIKKLQQSLIKNQQLAGLIHKQMKGKMSKMRSRSQGQIKKKCKENKKKSSIPTKLHMQNKNDGPKSVIRDIRKSCKTHKTNQLNSQSQYKCNGEYYKEILKGTGSDHCLSIYKKIVQIFDLVVQSIQLPNEIQTFLGKALKSLRKQIKNSHNSYTISNALTKFKLSTMQIIQKSPLSEICLFENTILPESNRWQPKILPSSSSIQKKRQKRIQTFVGLTLKIPNIDNKQEKFQSLLKIQRQLQKVFDKSFKHKKVYI